jgi:flagellin-like hook-associated protein FlgL
VQASIGDLERGQDRLLDALATIGSRTRLIDTARARAVDLDTGLATRQSGLEDADYAAGSVELNLATMALQAGVSISARIANLPSLVQLL